jgi:hypothetical protein
MESVARDPGSPLARVVYRVLAPRGEHANTPVPETPLRVYIAPTNYAGQAYLWARALERSDARIGARNAAVQLPGGYGFASDLSIPIAVANGSSAWAEREWERAKEFTHVLVEAERPMFGRRFGHDVRREIAALESAGVSVAFISHGTDVRSPDAHAERTPWSPYPHDPRTASLRREAAANLALLYDMRRPTFVSTPDLLDDVPWAHWCPVVIDPERFAASDEPFAAGPVRIVHASSSAVQKGSDLLEPALRPLIEAGAVQYRALEQTPAVDMPEAYRRTDVVLDQFRLGSYGVAACEAMAAGRLVIGHVRADVRARIVRAHGIELPIVEATPDTLAGVLADVVAHPDTARRLAAAGPGFVRRVHDGSESAAVLRRAWLEASAG